MHKQNATHGGLRPRAGRPAGSRNKATLEREAIEREAIARLHAAGLSNAGPMSPADIAAMSMIELIQYAAVVEAVAGRWLNAADLASKVAPYRHAKLSQVTSNTTVHRSIEEFTDEELVAIIGNGDDDGDGD